MPAVERLAEECGALRIPDVGQFHAEVAGDHLGDAIFESLLPAGWRRAGCWDRRRRGAGPGHDRSMRRAATLPGTPQEQIGLLVAEDIHRVSWLRVGFDIAHGAIGSERGVGIVGGDGRQRACAHPAADAGVDGDILLAVGAGEGDGIADDARGGFELPENFSAVRIDGAEPALHGSVEDEIAAGGKHAAVDGKQICP